MDAPRSTVALVASLALALTACSPGTGGRDDAAATPSPSATASASDEPGVGDDVATAPTSTAPDELGEGEPAGDGSTTAGTAGEDESQQPVAGDDPVATVVATNFEFDTRSLEVATGDAVEFAVEQGSHSFTSSGAGFDTGIFGDDTVTVVVEAAPGTYDYRCTLHGQMSGRITVTD